MASFSKRILASAGARTLLGPVLRLYRLAAFGGFLWRHDRRLLALLRSPAPAIFAVWHQDFVHTLGYLSRWNPSRKTFVLASPSRDGGLAASAAHAVGFRQVVRGSSSDRGAQALLRLARLLEEDPGASAAIVCDGPRPPARRLHPGALHLARASGRPLWLVRTSFSSRTVLARSWAAFHVPHPGSRAVCLADGPIVVPPTATRAELDTLRQAVEARLNALAARADRLASLRP